MFWEKYQMRRNYEELVNICRIHISLCVSLTILSGLDDNRFKDISYDA